MVVKFHLKFSADSEWNESSIVYKKIESLARDFDIKPGIVHL